MSLQESFTSIKDHKLWRDVSRPHNLLLVGGIGWIAAYFFGVLPTNVALGGGTFVAVSACIYSVVKGKMNPRLTSIFLLGAIALFAIGANFRASLGTLGDLSNDRSFLPDFFSIPGYLLIGATLVLLIRLRCKLSNFDAGIDALIAGLAVFILLWSAFLAPTVANDSIPIASRVLMAFYPPLSVALVALAARLVFDRGAAVNLSARYLLIAQALLFVGDTIYTFVDARMVTLPPTFIDAPYMLAYLLVAVAVVHPSAKDIGTPRLVPKAPPTQARLIAVSTGLLVPSAVLLFLPPSSAADRLIIGAMVMILTVAVAFRVFRALRSQAATQATLSHRAQHDLLTGLPNRSFAEDLLDEAAVNSSPTSLIFLDLDRFKRINDTYGHAAGDVLLVAAGKRIETLVRPGDVVGRFGGDEFVVVLPDTSFLEAMEVAEKIQQYLPEPLHLPFGKISSNTSAGVAYNDCKLGSTELIRRADLALYEAKDQGRNKVVLYDAELAARTTAKLGLEQDLDGALERDEFRLVYQPIVKPASGAITGFEALLRWDHPILPPSAVSPDKFISVAEDSGHIIPIGAWVLNEACAQLAKWREIRGHTDLTIAVNVSARQFVDPSFVEVVASTLVRHNLPATALNLEITESIFMAGGDTDHTFERLCTLGISLSIDDFGQGYSSLSYLRSFPVDHLKIDREYVARMLASSKDRALVEAIVAMSRALGLKTVAEGVEEAEQAEILTVLGCDYAQGFFFDRPLEPAEVDKRLGVGRLRSVPKLA